LLDSIAANGTCFSNAAIAPTYLTYSATYAAGPQCVFNGADAGTVTSGAYDPGAPTTICCQ
jgi:hypothetical protein